MLLTRITFMLRLNLFHSQQLLVGGCNVDYFYKNGNFKMLQILAQMQTSHAVLVVLHVTSLKIS